MRRHIVRIVILIFTLYINYLYASLPEARPTFHCIGLYWSPDDGSVDNPCQVFYRRTGEQIWQQGLSLWFDDLLHSGTSQYSYQYRGSIVNLLPGALYEIKLLLKSGTEQVLNVSTWSEDFKIKKVISLMTGESNETLHIEEGGSEEEGYVLYTPQDGQESIIDVKDSKPACIQVDASWIIIRGLVLRGATQHGVILNNVTNIVIEECEICGWGRIRENGWGENFDSAIYSSSARLEKIIVQRNKIYNPRSDANSWEENDHPEGPQAITFINGKGYYIIRYNEIWGDKDHYYNDSMGEYHNFSYAGFPNRDSDIYCNKISHCWDDAIESEGANMNVRIWSNLLDSTYMALGLATTALGPHYIFRNVSFFSQRAPKPVNKYTRNGGFAKLGTEDQEYTRGKMYFFHNTIGQPQSPWGQSNIKTNGCETGLGTTGSTKHQINITSRNNILCVNNYARDKNSIKMTDLVASNNFDYDIYNGYIPDIDGCELNGIELNWDQVPEYDSANQTFEFFLNRSSVGYDAGLPINNFNDGYEGSGPDIGAFETDHSALVWGVHANWTEWMRQSGVLVGKKEKTKNPQSFDLSVYPNPFNHSTRISYHLKKSVKANIAIFNMLGQIVDYIDLGQQSETSHFYNWNAENLPTGLYFVKMNAEREFQIIKCFLLK